MVRDDHVDGREAEPGDKRRDEQRTIQSWESARHVKLVPDNRDLPLESCSCILATKRKTYPTHNIKEWHCFFSDQHAAPCLAGNHSAPDHHGLHDNRKQDSHEHHSVYANDSDDQIKEDFYN